MSEIERDLLSDKSIGKIITMFFGVINTTIENILIDEPLTVIKDIQLDEGDYIFKLHTLYRNEYDESKVMCLRDGDKVEKPYIGNPRDCNELELKFVKDTLGQSILRLDNDDVFGNMTGILSLHSADIDMVGYICYELINVKEKEYVDRTLVFYEEEKVND